MNQTIELISIIIGNQDSKIVEPYIPQFIEKLFANKDFIGSDYFVAGWHRICASFDHFADLNLYYPIILGVVKNDIANNIG